MDEITKKTKELKQLIEETDLVKEYRRVEKLYQTNEELLLLAAKIERAAKENDESLRNELIKEFNKNPLVVNYTNLKQEVFDYLKEITNILNK